MPTIPVASAGKTKFYFDLEDVRQVCSVMKCSECLEECIDLMARGSMECRLCYSMMKVFGKRCRVSGAADRPARNRRKVFKTC